MIYTSTITGTPLRLRESRIIADLLLQRVSQEEWKDAILKRNVLQFKSSIGVTRNANVIRARLERLGEGLWKMVRDGERGLATQATLAAAIRHSRLLGDFMDLCLREQRALFADTLEKRVWTDYIAACRGRDPGMPHWSEATVAKLRSVVFSILAEASYIENTRTRRLQVVFTDSELSAYLQERGEAYVLRCLGVME